MEAPRALVHTLWGQVPSRLVSCTGTAPSTAQPAASAQWGACASYPAHTTLHATSGRTCVSYHGPDQMPCPASHSLHNDASGSSVAPCPVVGCNLDCKSERSAGGSAAEGVHWTSCRQCGINCNLQPATPRSMTIVPSGGEAEDGFAGWPGRTVRGSNGSTLGAHLHGTSDDMEKTRCPSSQACLPPCFPRSPDRCKAPQMQFAVMLPVKPRHARRLRSRLPWKQDYIS